MIARATNEALQASALRLTPKGKQVVLGLITTKHPPLENKSDVMRRLEEAARFVDADQLAISPQCGFACQRDRLARYSAVPVICIRFIIAIPMGTATIILKAIIEVNGKIAFMCDGADHLDA